MKDYNVLNDLVPTTQNLHRDIFDKGYDQGYKDGIADGNINNGTFAKKVKEAYNNGMNDAWEIARKLVLLPSDGGLDEEDVIEIFEDYTLNVLEKRSASEVKQKIEEWEQKQTDDEIKVGDEVYDIDKNYPRVVTTIICENKLAVQISKNGMWVVNDISELHKTGRHFNQIAEVLKQMQEDEE